MPLHRHEITVVMIPGGASGQVRIQKRHDSVPAQSTFIARGTFLTRCTVKDLEQNEIAGPADGRPRQNCREGSRPARRTAADMALDNNASSTSILVRIPTPANVYGSLIT
jgi:hypothetical protein